MRWKALLENPTKQLDKVQLFWEGHKNVRNCPYGFEIYLVNVKTMRTIAQIFGAFSEKLNFKGRKYFFKSLFVNFVDQ